MENENDNDNLKNAELTDEELDQAAGGTSRGDPVAKEKALADGHPVLADSVICNCIKDTGSDFNIPPEAYTVYAERKAIVSHGPDEYRNCKCYTCGKNHGNNNTLGATVK